MDYLTLKKQVLNKYFSRTNDMQKKGGVPHKRSSAYSGRRRKR